MPTIPPPHPQTPNPTLPSRANKQVLCPGHTRNSSGGGNCDISSHPTIRGGRYCASHQLICLLCPDNPRYLIGERCRSCVGRERAAERAAREARAAERMQMQTVTVTQTQTQTVRTVTKTKTDTKTMRKRKRRGMNRRCGGMKRKH